MRLLHLVAVVLGATVQPLALGASNQDGSDAPTPYPHETIHAYPTSTSNAITSSPLSTDVFELKCPGFKQFSSGTLATTDANTFPFCEKEEDCLAPMRILVAEMKACGLTQTARGRFMAMLAVCEQPALSKEQVASLLKNSSDEANTSCVPDYRMSAIAEEARANLTGFEPVATTVPPALSTGVAVASDAPPSPVPTTTSGTHSVSVVSTFGALVVAMTMLEAV